MVEIEFRKIKIKVFHRVNTFDLIGHKTTFCVLGFTNNGYFAKVLNKGIECRTS